MTAARIRLAYYALAVLGGAALVTAGIVQKDPALITAGAGLITTGGLAGANIGTTDPAGDHAAE